MLIQLNQDDLVLRGNFVKSFLNKYRSEDTIRTYESAIKKFYKVDNVSKINLKMIKNTGIVNVENWIKEELSKGNSIKTVKKDLYALKNLVDYVMSLSGRIEIKYNVFNDSEIKRTMRLNKESKEDEIDILSKDEIQRLLDYPKGYYDQLLLKCLLNWGVRRSEIVKIEWKSIYEYDGEWYVRVKGKGNKERDIYINEELLEMLRDLEWKFGKLGSKSSRKIFDMSGTTVNNKVKKYCELIGINDKNITAHCMRHTVITDLVNSGCDKGVVKDYAGHENWNTTLRYFHREEKRKNNGGRVVNY